MYSGLIYADSMDDVTARIFLARCDTPDVVEFLSVVSTILREAQYSGMLIPLPQVPEQELELYNVE